MRTERNKAKKLMDEFIYDITRVNGITQYHLNGQLHREGGPAVIHSKGAYDEGMQLWYKHGVLHNEHGPAVIRKEQVTYFLDGRKYTKKAWKKEVARREYLNKHGRWLDNH